MANKRMFSMSILDSDAFLDMPLSTQALYLHLNMRADDDGFVSNPKRIQRLIGASEDDLKLLLAKRFLLVFEDGVMVIKHWRMHNTIRADRYTPTPYQDELSRLFIKQNKSYSLTEGEPVAKRLPDGCQDVIPSGNPGLGLDIGLDIGLDKDLDKDLDKETDIDKDKEKNNKKTLTMVLNSYAPVGSELRNALDEFKEMRIKKKKPLTVIALERALKKLDTLSANDEQTKLSIVLQTLDHSWDTFYELKVNNGYVNASSNEEKRRRVEEWLNSDTGSTGDGLF